MRNIGTREPFDRLKGKSAAVSDFDLQKQA